MSFLQAAIGDIVSIVAFALIVAGVVKVVQISTDIGEIKDLLRDIKRNTQDFSPETVTSLAEGSAAPFAESGEALLRALSPEPDPVDSPEAPRLSGFGSGQ